MKPTTAALAKVASLDPRPAFSLALMIAEEIRHQPKRLMLNKLVDLFRLVCDAVLATHDVATATVIYFGDKDTNSYRISPEQVTSLSNDVEMIAEALRLVPTDAQGRTLISKISGVLARIRLQQVA